MKKIQLAVHIRKQPAFWGEQILLDNMPCKFIKAICQCFTWVVNYNMEVGHITNLAMMANPAIYYQISRFRLETP